ncbi:MAG: PqqD family protein [Candidatus Omnitrophica bacterium]|jgi:hypothetical protein|nr:PqqD family protein [Candidatus Omnitrophota bacterium]
MVNDYCVIKTSEDLVCRFVDGDIFIVSLRTGKYYSLNASAVVIWEKITGKDFSVKAVVDWAVKKFSSATENDIRLGVNDFLKDLENQGLITLLSDKDKIAPAGACKKKGYANLPGAGLSNGMDAYIKPQLINYENQQVAKEGRKVYACPIHIDYFSEWDTCAL